MDFVFANRLHFIRRVTGELTIPEYFLQQPTAKIRDSISKYSKNNILEYIRHKYHVMPQNVIYVGSGADGSTSLRASGYRRGIRFPETGNQEDR